MADQVIPSASPAGPGTRSLRAPAQARFRRAVQRLLPEGRALPPAIWERRHRDVTRILWLHVVGVFAFGLWVGAQPAHAIFEALIVAIPAGLASLRVVGRAGRSVAASLGLMAASATLVHLSGGSIEMHFHFFVMVGLISLYQSWQPFLTSIAFVFLHHLVLGTIAPASVFDHGDAQAHPLWWAVIHGGFILAASAVSLTNWGLVEHERLHDALTGLWNRTGFADHVGAAIASAVAAPADARPTVAVLYLDLNAFRQVNEQFGLSIGDAVLPIVASRLREAVEPAGVVARSGGDEFTVLLPATDPETIEGRAHRIRRSIEAGLLVGERELRLSISVGIATAHLGDDPIDTPDTLVRNAETAMLMAKQRNQPQEYFDPSMRARLIERLRLRQDLEVAVESGAIQPAFQPIVQLETGQPIAVEALARWTHPERGPVPPVEFITVAEETDLILRIGRRIILESCLRLGEWQRNGIVDREFMVSVNLSTRQLEDPSLVAFVMSVLDEARIDPHCLILEVTETAVLQDSPLVVAQIEALRGIGVRLAIDDFGTGYSSLNYLRQMPIQILKIDRSFVEDLDLVLDNRSLVGTILSLGEGMDLRTVAEGIERPAQVEVLRSLGCRYGQGYHFSRPLDGEAIVAWLEANQPDRHAPGQAPADPAAAPDVAA